MIFFQLMIRMVDYPTQIGFSKGLDMQLLIVISLMYLWRVPLHLESGERYNVFVKERFDRAMEIQADTPFSPLLFENKWPNEPDLDNVVQISWRGFEEYDVLRRVHATTGVLQIWGDHIATRGRIKRSWS
ncbi:hypothetical protein ACS0TY_018418 [Phlomoides rotata]